MDFVNKLGAGESVVGIIGLGYVGQPLMLAFADVGLRVLGFDINSQIVDSLNNGRSPIRHIEDDAIAGIRRDGLFEATTDFSRTAEADALIICVPTPLDRYREPDLSFIRNTLEAIAPHLRAGQLLSLESTTYPGTTREVVLPFVERAGLRVGEDFFVVYSPEREDPGNPDFTTRTIPKICGGVTPACLRAGAALYGRIIDEVVQVSSPEVAEMAKLLENIHRAVNIGLVNEMKIVADKMGLDIFEVINAAATKPFGFVPYYPGPGIGGHCIPIDPFYLTWKAREYDVHTRFIELAGEINTNMPRYVVSKIMEALNRQGKPMKGSRIMVLGVAYKKNVDDMRESPSLTIMKLVREAGAELFYSDPYIPELPKTRHYDFDLRSTPVTPETLAESDCVVLATDHDAFDYDLIEQHAPLIVDTRGRWPASEKVVKA